MWILFLFLVSGEGAHTNTTVETAAFKNQFSCEAALEAAIANAPPEADASGFCQPAKSKPAK